MTIVNTETGEVLSGEIVPAGDMTALDTLDPQSREVAVTQYLSTARDRLALALEATGPQAVAQLKAEIATAAEATKQLGLSKEIQLDAQEMVRRAEYALGKAIRKGQEEGTIARRGEIRNARGGFNEEGRETKNFGKQSPKDYFSSGQEAHETYALSDAVSEEQFDAAIDDAKAEGNISRANVVRKVKSQQPASPAASERLDEIADLAEQGYTSRQIAKRLGIGEEWLSRIRREHGIEVPADKLLGKTRRHDSTRIVNETVMSLAGLTTALELIDYDDLDPTEAAEWAASLSESFRVLNRFHKKIKETAHVG